MNLKDLTGERIGKLTVMKRAPNKLSASRSRTMWTCICDCGNIVDVLADYLKSSKCPSCGCEARKNKIEKRHFKFTYESPITGKDIYILLDVIFEENHYKHLVEKEIKNDLLMTEGENLKVKIPSINCILGDKLTAFAPHTTGILLNTGKDMEVMKQMYDVHTLLNKFDDFDEMISTYNSIIDQEIAYRGTHIDRNDVLDDTYAAALCIASRGKTNWEEYRYYVNGIRSLRSHLFEENYSPEIAARKAAKILYLTTCIKKGVHFHKIEDPLLYKDRNYIGTEMSSLKYFRKVDMEAFAYTIETDLLLNS